MDFKYNQQNICFDKIYSIIRRIFLNFLDYKLMLLSFGLKLFER